MKLYSEFLLEIAKRKTPLSPEEKKKRTEELQSKIVIKKKEIYKHAWHGNTAVNRMAKKLSPHRDAMSPEEIENIPTDEIESAMKYAIKMNRTVRNSSAYDKVKELLNLQSRLDKMSK